MANEEHLKILKHGVDQWNKWRLENAIRPDLGNADLSGANLSGADLSGANLSGANLSGANLSDANLSDANLLRANLTGAKLSDAILVGANLSGASLTLANLSGANLFDARLQGANLTSADLTDADLSRTSLVETDFTNATITGCRIYGASAWNVTLVGTVQHNLVITKEGEPVVTVDDLEVGQFIYLILNNTKIRNVINTLTSKGVLILGRFSDPQRKSVLDGLREGLRNFGLLPIAFDLDRPTAKDDTETIQTLAGMSMFVIADLTSPKSTPLELEATVKQFKIPVIPIIDISVDPRPFAMLVDLQKSSHWVLPTLKYESKEDLLDGENLKTYIIEPAFAKREQLRERPQREQRKAISPAATGLPSYTKRQRTRVFISYNHRDARWLSRLQVHLMPLARDFGIDLWDDTKIKSGMNWRQAINDAIQTAKVAILLVSADFLASEFIVKNELPPLLAAARNEGTLILPVILSPSMFVDLPELSQYQTLNDPATPLVSMLKGKQEKTFYDLAVRVRSHFSS